MENIIVTPGTAQHHDLISNVKFKDDRGLLPALEEDLNNRLRVSFSNQDIQKYRRFIGSFLRIKNQKNTTDFETVQSIRQLVHGYFLKNKNSIAVDSKGLSSVPEWERFPENFLVSVASRATACGTISEATVALLRSVGYATRLIRIAYQASNVEAKHVFLEYYSRSFKKWIMVDAMEDFTPFYDHKPLSAFEYFALHDKQKVYQDTGVDGYSHDMWENIIWFNKNGPFKKIFYFANTVDVRKALLRELQ